MLDRDQTQQLSALVIKLARLPDGDLPAKALGSDPGVTGSTPVSPAKKSGTSRGSAVPEKFA